MDSLYWDTFTSIDSSSDSASNEDSDTECDSENGGARPLTPTERNPRQRRQQQQPQQQEQSQWRRWGVSVEYETAQERARPCRRRHVDDERTRAPVAPVELPSSERRQPYIPDNCYCYINYRCYYCRNREPPRPPPVIPNTSRPSPPPYSPPTAAEPLVVERKGEEEEKGETIYKDASTMTSPSLGHSPMAPPRCTTTLGLMSPVRLVSFVCVATGAALCLRVIRRSPWKLFPDFPWNNGTFCLLLAGGFAYHDVWLEEMGLTTCGLNSILEWI